MKNSKQKRPLILPLPFCTLHSALCITLLLAVVSPQAGVELPAQRRGDVTARAEVRVAAVGAGPGRARAAFTIRVEGPATLQVEGPRLEDALAAWRVQREASSWTQDRSATWESTLALVQTKPGAVPLPGLRLRVRGGPGEDWQDVSWLDPLHEPRDVAPLVELPPLPPSAWPRRLLLGSAIAVPILLLAAVAWRASRRSIAAPLQPPWRQALARLGEGVGVEQASAAVRVFLQEQGGLAASRLTTDELLTNLRSRGDLAEETLTQLRQLFELADLVKFAGHSPTAEEEDSARRLGREVVERLATWPAGEKRLPGEDG